MVLCPCGSGQSLDTCCQPYINGQATAPTAEGLMRSRYTAYSLGKIDYLLKTHHPAHRAHNERMVLAESIRTTTWARLKVLATHQGTAQDKEGTVEFVAYHITPSLGQIHECSRFIRQKDRWFYVDGHMLPPLWPKRSEPCWCGSGKRYKACHG